MAISTSKDCPKCGSNHKSKPFATYEDGWHCFSCGASKRAIRNFQTTRLETSDEITLPELLRNPNMFSLPVLKWLRSYHVSDDLIYKYNIAEAIDHSVITPVMEGGKVVMYQRRWFEPRRIMTYGKKQPFIASTKQCDTIVIVEDFISAIRVGEVCDALCMFGTSIPVSTIEALVQTYNDIVIWADGDNPGQKAAKKLTNAIKMAQAQEVQKRSFVYSFDKKVTNILTEHDPKVYTKSIIDSIVFKRRSHYMTNQLYVKGFK